MRIGLGVVCGVLCALSLSTVAEAQRHVLLYSPGGDRATSVFPSSGPDMAVVTRVDADGWAALTAADFASYDLIWIDEQSCAGSAGSTYAPVAANRATWSPQVTGNVVLVAGDPTYHGSGTGFNRNAYYWATSGTGTGLYASIGCIGSSGGTVTPDWLQGLGSITYTGLGCSDSISFPDSSHPLITTPSAITPSGMSVGCFFHERWVSFPSTFRAVIHVSGSNAGVIVRESTLDANGSPCTDPSTCASGFCVDGVCCDTVCGAGATDDCQACVSTLSTASDGVCAPIRGGTECRASGGLCDPAEICDGSTAACPSDSLSAPGTSCRASSGGCDPAEACDGASADCPSDAFSPDGVECRPSAGVCDVTETCTGDGATCPADARVTAGTECRATMGVCDTAESCDGASVACPMDSFVSGGTECRSAMGICDTAETCTGSTAGCPMDIFVAAGTECRGAAGSCDVPEACDGASPACPGDAFVTAATECRGAAGSCDLAEMCDGLGAASPADTRVPEYTECRAAGGACDLPEACDGTSAACPDDALATVGTECRAVGGACDLPEACDGASAACPEDAFVEDGASCDDGEVCNGLQTCTSGACSDASPLDCDDGNHCTADMCAEPDGCTNAPIEGCCASDIDCADTDECTLDTCDVETGICPNTQVDGCGMEPTGDGGLLGDAGAGVPEVGGCGCSVPGGHTGGTAWLVVTLIGLVGWRRRRG